ncbi:uncharacterized protein ASPGLDRAFT_35181 [Aspergillus glaucus CBS 516.65]|uniref:Uncharacterized protein n=1 Tax=Aspergillus glaucus CBS 516.65 TaxID=1160497 RepID=A0A1L9VLD5_ASPGL|nr:hypothetical protein ASPGLDRAFT_35181 [Aspergillus glaucus CBS 516.65]OJJ84701.1 hypothetical protein ASPGLDRAFT_35181 [Aspergillus glaucus CBS 516.65]
MKPLQVFASRMPRSIFYDILGDFDVAMSQFDPLQVQENEECEGSFESNITRKGCIKHHFTIFDTVSVISVEVKKALGGHDLDMKGQILADCAACEFANRKAGQ